MSLKIAEGQEQILQLALDIWGVDEQFGMANEEFGECITAINQYKRGRIGKSQLAGEIADAFIMASQLAIIAGESEVQELIEYKIRRLRDRLERVQAAISSTV